MYKKAKRILNNFKFQHGYPVVPCFLQKKYKAKGGSDYRFAHKGDTFPYRNPKASMMEAPVCKRLVKTCAKMDEKNSSTYMCHVVTPCQVS